MSGACKQHLSANLDRNEVVLCSDKGVSNHWAGICNETIQLKMEWNSERTQLQLTCATRDHIHYISGVTGIAQLSSVSLGLLSHRTSKYRAVYANCMQAWHSC